MNQEYRQLEGRLETLLTGLADQEIKFGRNFGYSGGRLYADEVGHICLPSALCIAQHIGLRLGLDDLGYHFTLGEPNPVFLVHAQPDIMRSAPAFSMAAPLVMEAFTAKLMDCRHDVALFFETAAKLIHPEYSLKTHTAYQ